MITASGQYNPVVLLQPNPHPFIAFTPEVKETATLQDGSDLFIPTFSPFIAHLLR